MVGVRVRVIRYVSPDPQPGLVECELIDANGRAWLFVEKAAVVSCESLGPKTQFPQEGVIACEVIGQTLRTDGKKLVRIDTELPFGVETVDGEHRFEIPEESLVERTDPMGD